MGPESNADFISEDHSLGYLQGFLDAAEFVNNYAVLFINETKNSENPEVFTGEITVLTNLAELISVRVDNLNEKFGIKN